MLSFRNCLLVSAVLVGCADSSAPVSEPSAAADPVSVQSQVPTVDDHKSVPTAPTADAPMDFEFAPLSTSTTGGDGSAVGNHAAGESQPLTDEARRRAIMVRLKPLQVMLGNWRGTTRKEFDGMKAVDNHEWIWDLQTNPQQPALVVTSDKSPYLARASLTWDVKQSQFRLTATDSSGVTREYTGDYTDPVHEIVGPDDKLHRVFRLQLTQTEGPVQPTADERWQIAFSQQENNRYLLEIDKRRGSAAFRRYDTVSTQREGTSFAVSDSDYGEKSCIISQGLGTIAVSHKGRTYWVCCSGCKAAFEDDPETWIARAEQRAKAE